MAKAKQRGLTSELTSKSLSELWDAGSPADWRSFLEEIAPGCSWAPHGKAVRGLCPLGTHSDSKPSFIIDLQRGHAKCWSAACEYFERNPVLFIKRIAKCSTTQAVSKIKDHFGLKKFTKKLMDELQGFDMTQRVKQTIATEGRNVLIDAHFKPEEESNAYAREAVEYLIARDIAPDLWHMLPIGVLPSLEHFHAKYSKSEPDLYQALFKYLEETYQSRTTGWILFVNTRSATEIGRLRLRKPDPHNKALVAVADKYEPNVGLFGVNVYRSLFGHPSAAKHAFVVEGEFDQLALAVGQLQTGQLDQIVVSKGGETNRDISDLVSLGVESVHWVGDYDEAGRRAGLMLAKEAPEELSFNHYQWDTKAPHKCDPHDAIRLHGFGKFYDDLGDNKQYLYTYQVTFQIADEQLRKTNPDDVKRRNEIVIEHAKKYLKNEAEKKAFFQLIEERHNISHQDLLRETSVEEESFEGFARKLAKLIDEKYTVIGTRQDGGDKGSTVEILLWNREKNDTRMLALARPNDCIAQLVQDVGSLLSWCRDTIGIPMVMTHRFIRTQSGDAIPMPLPLDAQQRNMKTALVEALQILAGKSQDIRGIRERSQGVHVLGAPDGIPEVGILNGEEIYLVRYEKGGPKIEQLDNPLYRDSLFIPNVRTKWSVCLRGDRIMEEAAASDPLKVFKDLKKMADTGWTFLHQDIDTTYCALLAMILPYMALFPGTLMTFISGAYMSGKTKLLRQFFSISGDKMFGIVEPAFTSDDYTVAGVRQQMNNAAMALVLDEFEDKGNNSTRSRIVRELLTAFRSMIADNSVRTQGTVSGKAREYNLNFPIIMAAAHPPRELADLSRVVMLVMQQRKDHIPPDQAILQVFDTDEIKSLRRQVTLALLPHVPELVMLYWQTRKELTALPIMPAEVDSRFKETVIPLITLYRFLKLPWKKFASELATVKRINEDEYVGVRSEGEIIFEALLDTVIRPDLPGFSGDTTIRQLLYNEQTRSSVLGEGYLGVYYYAEENWLVIHWTHAESAILRGRQSTLEGQRTAAQLKALCDSCELCVPLQKAWPKIQKIFKGPGFNRKTLSVFDINKALGELPKEINVSNLTRLDASKSKHEISPEIPGEEDLKGKK